MSKDDGEKFEPTKVKGTAMGEWKWETKVCLVAMLVCFLIACTKHRENMDFVSFISDGAFHSTLLFGCWFYLSDLRYRLCKDVRND